MLFGSMTDGNHRTRRRFSTLMRHTALIAQARLARGDARPAGAPDQPRLREQYRPLIERARAAQAWLVAHRLGDLTFEEFGLTEDALVWWHFEGQGSPRPPELAVYARSVGLEDDREFVRTLFHEFVYVSATA
jgi:hypothetical protein